MLGLFSQRFHEKPRTLARRYLAFISARWRHLTLVQRFTVTGITVVLVGMTAIGFWVADRIRNGIIDNTATASAIHIDNYVAHLAQELVTSDRLSPAAIADLDRSLGTLADRAASMKIWRPDGTVAYSNWKDLIGKRFPLTSNLRAALNGRIAAEFNGEAHEGDEHDQKIRGSVVEIYAPMHDAKTGAIIAVIEYYSLQPDLDARLRDAQLESWFVVGSVTFLMSLSLFGIVLNGSRTIDLQRLHLHRQIRELEALLRQNQQLRMSVQRARQRSAEINEQVLRRVGSELHDGPAQLISLALLSLDLLDPSQGKTSDEDRTAADRERVGGALSDALAEIRAISAGLVLPDIGRMSLHDVIRLAGDMHARRTSTEVAFDVSLPDLVVPAQLKVCIYRVVQEGLNNCLKHAAGQGQKVIASYADDMILVAISDHGPGLRATSGERINEGLGLLGLRDRVETLDGTLTFTPSPDGSELAATFDLASAVLKQAKHGG